MKYLSVPFCKFPLERYNYALSVSSSRWAMWDRKVKIWLSSWSISWRDCGKRTGTHAQWEYQWTISNETESRRKKIECEWSRVKQYVGEWKKSNRSELRNDLNLKQSPEFNSYMRALLHTHALSAPSCATLQSNSFPSKSILTATPSHLHTVAARSCPL